MLNYDAFFILPKCSLGSGGYLQPNYSRDSGRYGCDSGRAAVPQMTHTPQLVCYFSSQRNAQPAATLRDLVLRVQKAVQVIHKEANKLVVPVPMLGLTQLSNYI